MTKREWTSDERELGGYADWDEVVKIVNKIKETYPEAKDIMIIASTYWDSATSRIEFSRYQTNEELEKERLRAQRVEDNEREQYLKLKAKFENKGNG